MAITAEYDREADALYVRLAEGLRDHAIEIDESTYVDVDVDGHALGLEFLYPSIGIDVHGAARRLSLEEQIPAIVAAITRAGAPISPQTMTGGQHLASTSMVMVAVEGTVPAARETTSPTVGHADRVIHGAVCA